MWAAVRWMVSTMEQAAFTTLESVRLVAAVAVGVAAYGVAMTVLYLICGRPEGAERLLIDRFAPKLRAWVRMPK